jgi:hypothetical protein
LISESVHEAIKETESILALLFKAAESSNAALLAAVGEAGSCLLSCILSADPSEVVADRPGPTEALDVNESDSAKSGKKKLKAFPESLAILKQWSLRACSAPVAVRRDRQYAVAYIQSCFFDGLTRHENAHKLLAQLVPILGDLGSYSRVPLPDAIISRALFHTVLQCFVKSMSYANACITIDAVIAHVTDHLNEMPSSSAAVLLKLLTFLLGDCAIASYAPSESLVKVLLSCIREESSLVRAASASAFAALVRSRPDTSSPLLTELSRLLE